MRESADRRGLEHLDWDSGRELTETLHVAETKERMVRRRRSTLTELVCLHMLLMGERRKERGLGDQRERECVCKERGSKSEKDISLNSQPDEAGKNGFVKEKLRSQYFFLSYFSKITLFLK